MSSSQGQKNKAKTTSTPERDSNETLQCDLSMIRPLDLTTSSRNGQTAIVGASNNGPAPARSSSRKSIAPPSEFKPKPVTRKEETYTEEDMATAVANAHLQSQLMKFLVEKCTVQMQKNYEEDMCKLQKEIEKEQKRGKELKTMLKTIETNKQIEKRLDAQDKIIGQLVENLKVGNVAENVITKCDAVTKELEKNQDKLVCTNITIPESDESQENLRSMISDTKEAYAELTSELARLQVDEMLVEALDKTFKSTEEFAERQKRCEECLKELQRLIARENTLRIMVALEEKMKTIMIKKN